MSTRTPRLLLALAFTVLAAGCGSDSPAPSAPSSNTLDVASVLSQMSFGNINAIGANAGALALGGAAMPASVAAPSVVPSACTYSATTGGFACPQTKVGGLTFSVSYFLYDAAGHSLTTPDASTVASIRSVTDASGTLTAAAGTTGTATVTDHEDMTLSGLLTSTRTLNGTGKSNFDVTFTAPVALHSILNQTSTTSNVVLPSGSGAKWPQSGTITSDIQATSSTAGLPAVTFPIHTVVAFSGSSVVTVTTTSDSFTAKCTIDLSGKTMPTCSFN